MSPLYKHCYEVKERLWLPWRLNIFRWKLYYTVSHFCLVFFVTFIGIIDQQNVSTITGKCIIAFWWQDFENCSWHMYCSSMIINTSQKFTYLLFVESYKFPAWNTIYLPRGSKYLLYSYRTYTPTLSNYYHHTESILYYRNKFLFFPMNTKTFIWIMGDKCEG